LKRYVPRKFNWDSDERDDTMLGSTTALWCVSVLGALTTLVDAHGVHAPIDLHSHAKRYEKVSKCSDHVGLMARERFERQRRSGMLSKRGTFGEHGQHGQHGGPDEDKGTTYQIKAAAPHYDFLKNDTCILTPEVTQGPYQWTASQILRQDMTEGQAGIPLVLDIGVIDINTCGALPNALIDLWHCNATGYYSSYTGANPNMILTPKSLPKVFKMPNATDTTTFLRGMWPTDKHGVTEMRTVFPGFYSGRSIHIHVQVHTDWAVSSNGTLVGGTGKTVSTGQIFFDEALSAKFMATEPYVSHTQIKRVTNEKDGIYEQEIMTGFNAFASVEPLDGKDVMNGILGYITLGVDTTAIRNGSTAPPMGISISSDSASATATSTSSAT
jgi:protocatechuate 3,4-dioxygenase beta subunit